jgi:flagellar biosynthesis/type III secretory pathway protein FliH
VETFAFEQFDAAMDVAGAATAAERAARIVARARAQAGAVAAEAREEGYAAGYAAGLEEARAEIAPATEALAAAVDAVAAVREEAAGLVERRAVELALAVAEKVLGAAIDARPELVLEVVGSALRRAVLRDFVVLEVNPADLSLVRDAMGEITDRLGGFGRIDVVAERRVSRGGCVLRTGEGEIDASLEGQLLRAREVLADALRAPGTPSGS